uniref:Globoside alpha-1,3-N-acetylgalactosaminyltransferase 1 (FORS blood group) n=1 Tax=Chelydra serpentina TaxID=8475 RepID=A0A8C3T6U5_CHESE
MDSVTFSVTFVAGLGAARIFRQPLVQQQEQFRCGQGVGLRGSNYLGGRLPGSGQHDPTSPDLGGGARGLCTLSLIGAVLFCLLPFSSSFRRQDVLTLTPWLAPIVWEGTFNSELLDSAYNRPTALFVGRFVESAEKLFMKGYRVNYYIFTNDPQVIPRVQLQPGRSLRIVPIKKYSHWQEISMRRMEAINRHVAEVSHREVNYLFCLDIDMVFHNPWGVETLGEMVAAIHPGYFNVPRSQFPYERRSSSAAFIPDRQGDFYYAGAVFGGLVKQVYEFTRACHMTILADKANGIMAAWQEESHLNRHFFSHKPSKLLSPEYVWDDTKPRPPEVRLIRFSTVNKNYKELRD